MKRVIIYISNIVRLYVLFAVAYWFIAGLIILLTCFASLLSADGLSEKETREVVNSGYEIYFEEELYDITSMNRKELFKFFGMNNVDVNDFSMEVYVKKNPVYNFMLDNDESITNTLIKAYKYFLLALTVVVIVYCLSKKKGCEFTNVHD